MVTSADVPPITIARWYGGHAAVPSVLTFDSMNGRRRSRFRIAAVSW